MQRRSLFEANRSSADQRGRAKEAKLRHELRHAALEFVGTRVGPGRETSGAKGVVTNGS